MRRKQAVERAAPVSGGAHATKLPSGLTEVYFAEAPGAPLVVVYHIQKTAGTSLRRFVRANLPPARREPAADLQKLRYRPDELLAWHREWYDSLDPARRERLCCVMSHSAGYLLPALDRPAEALTVVREPLDRVLSFYYYKRRRPHEPPDSRRTEDFFDLEQVYRAGEEERARLKRPARLESWAQFYNWQSRSLLSVFHDVSGLAFSRGPSPDADIWRARLRSIVEDVFTVGVQDRFAEYVDVLARRFAWKPVVTASKVNERRPPASELSGELRETILACNWLDTELYQLCRETQLRAEAGSVGR